LLFNVSFETSLKVFLWRKISTSCEYCDIT